jgi:hypothetical protein
MTDAMYQLLYLIESLTSIVFHIVLLFLINKYIREA